MVMVIREGRWGRPPAASNVRSRVFNQLDVGSGSVESSRSHSRGRNEGRTGRDGEAAAIEMQQNPPQQSGWGWGCRAVELSRVESSRVDSTRTEPNRTELSRDEPSKSFPLRGCRCRCRGGGHGAEHPAQLFISLNYSAPVKRVTVRVLYSIHSLHSRLWHYLCTGYTWVSPDQIRLDSRRDDDDSETKTLTRQPTLLRNTNPTRIRIKT